VVRKEVLMIAKSYITIRTDDVVKRQATDILANMGMDMTTGINIFLRSLVRCVFRRT